ncbi:MAG: exonuclease SbcCD subunit D [Lachnospiraceae bacterium]|nr:exonuclease SbcCD subunit D [Lachnospiraceae bacterium]
MKLIHLSDLHLGKRVNEFSMLEDQKDILNKIIAVIKEEQPDAVLIAGDVYDKSVPSAEAVELFDEFLVQLANTKTQVFIISGNHDSAERLAFAGRLIDASGIHLAPVYKGEVAPFSFPDEYGTVDIYMLPFVKPANVRRFFPEEEIRNYEDAMKTAICAMKVNEKNRSILITHQFVTGALVSDSEDLSVGGTDQVSAEVFEVFDYVALGHLHRPQNVKEKIRYCGTPLKYSFSEVNDAKSVTVVELKEKGNLSVREIPLAPLHEMKEIKGNYTDLTFKGYYDAHPELKDSYLHITLTDEEDVPDAAAKLRVIYPLLMKLDYDNTRTRNQQRVTALSEVEKKTPMELFDAFFEMQNGQEMSAEQKQYVETLIEKIWEGDK